MQDLRLVGVHDDGEHLLLSGTGGDIFRLRIDEALKVASSKTPARTASLPPTPAGVRLSPREIQMQIRAGASAESVAESSGLPLAQVQRYEGPVLAERDYIATQARRVQVQAALPGHDGYRSAFGDNPANLEEMVAHRLAAFGIDPVSVSWDAWRRHDGTWTVAADFNPGHSAAAASIGEPAPAQWIFNASRRTIANTNRWAQQLSELEPLDGPVPSRRLAAVADRPFDIESDDGEAGTEAAAARESERANGLLDMLRARRGQRLGVDVDEDDALALLLAQSTPPPPARPWLATDETAAAGPAVAGGEPVAVEADGEPAGDSGAPEAEDAVEAASTLPPPRPARNFPLLSLAPQLPEEESSIALHEVSTETREIRISAAPASFGVAAAATAEEPAATAVITAPTDVVPGPGPVSSAAADKLERKPAAKPKRSSVPSWDEIVFGTKGD
ncbi:septation protein SepH [Pseudarthrobacter sp. P1]|uniref:septation protein SepH n=1 Tax=Pseudarthrobacter sp. P1 TaxID=3418418 RepID=UPI003CF6C602